MVFPFFHSKYGKQDRKELPDQRRNSTKTRKTVAMPTMKWSFASLLILTLVWEVIHGSVLHASATTNNNLPPVLAFYYPWYTTSSWDPNKMSDLPTTPYNSSDDNTINRQVNEAANTGI